MGGKDIEGPEKKNWVTKKGESWGGFWREAGASLEGAPSHEKVAINSRISQKKRKESGRGARWQRGGGDTRPGGGRGSSNRAGGIRRRGGGAFGGSFFIRRWEKKYLTKGGGRNTVYGKGGGGTG